MKELFYGLLQKKSFLRYILLMVIVLVSGTLFFIITAANKNRVEEKVDIEEVVVENYPLFIGTEDVVLNINGNAAVAVYYSSKGEEIILYNYNADKELAIASISKLMTALVAYNNYNINDPINVSEQEIVSKTEFRDFRAWKDTTISDMLHQVIIESNNSAAYAMGLISNRYMPSEEDSVSSFVKKMNQTGLDIGLKKTTFINPSGLDGKDDYNSSTALEIATLTKHIIDKKPLIMDISTIPSYKVYSPDKSIYYQSLNTNNFLHQKNNDWQSLIVGGKTGYTKIANGCLMIALAGPNGDDYIINVILGASDRFQEMERLINYIYEYYHF